jgi:hypothetical protein
VSFTDNFTRANGGLGGNWTTHSSYVAPQIVSNKVNPNATGGSGSGAYYSATSWPNDHYSQCTINALLDVNALVDIAVRMDSSANTFYYLQIKGPIGASALWHIKKIVTGTPTTLIAATTFTLAVGDKLKISVIGNALTAYQNNSTLGSTTDGSISAGNAGFICGCASATTDTALTGWEGGGFTAFRKTFSPIGTRTGARQLQG